MFLRTQRRNGESQMGHTRNKRSRLLTSFIQALTMSNSARKTSTVGEIVSLMSVDCQRIQDAFTYSAFILSLIFITAGN